jgi:carbon monoxide dehydrogenase subunit G
VIEERGAIDGRISGTQTIDAPIEKVWAYLLDVHKVVVCVPGFQSLQDLGEEHWSAIVAISVGLVKAKFTLDVTRPEKHEPDRMTVQGRGKAPGSTVELSGKMNLSVIDAGHTRMDWNAQVLVSGTIASVGTRLLHGTAEKLTQQFFDCLKAKLQTPDTVGAGE